jgi:hypothetical protein
VDEITRIAEKSNSETLSSLVPACHGPRYEANAYLSTSIVQVLMLALAVKLILVLVLALVLNEAIITQDELVRCHDQVILKPAFWTTTELRQSLILEMPSAGAKPIHKLGITS